MHRHHATLEQHLILTDAQIEGRGCLLYTETRNADTFPAMGEDFVWSTQM